MYLLIMVLDDSAYLNDVLAAWMEAGVPGVTILESTGLNRVLQRNAPDVAYAGFSQFFGGGRIGHNTLFSVIEDLATAEKAVAATEKIIGSLNKPRTGIIFALPIAQSWGVMNGDEEDVE